MYSDLAPWFHLLTHPSDYWDEARRTRVVDDVAIGEATTLLELGLGGGTTRRTSKARFTCTLTDLSPDMLALSRTLNPECEHLEGDMRTLRLGREFDVVFIHDAISYLTTEEDLRAAIETAAVHVRPGGVVILTPDATTEIFQPERPITAATTVTTVAASATSSGRMATGSTYEVDYLIIARGPGEEERVVHDRHTLGVFPGATWEGLIAQAGLEFVDTTVENLHELEQAAFPARRPTT